MIRVLILGIVSDRAPKAGVKDLIVFTTDEDEDEELEYDLELFDTPSMLNYNCGIPLK